MFLGYCWSLPEVQRWGGWNPHCLVVRGLGEPPGNCLQPCDGQQEDWERQGGGV